MELTILGSGTALPNSQHSASGYLVRVGDTPILFDMGPGTLARLAAAGVSYQDLEYIFLTHHHSDHVLDLVTFLQANDSTPGWTRSRPVHLTGCRGTQNFYEQLMGTFPGIAPQSYSLDIREMGEERIEFGAWTMESALTGHTENSVGFRLEAQGKVFVYSGDATERGNLARLAREADVFVCECAFPRGWQTNDHMTADAAGRVARAARVKKLVLTHLYPPALQQDVAEQARREFNGDVMVASDGTRLEV